MNTLKFCTLILIGAKGDLKQNDAGGFFYHAGLPADCQSPELISVDDVTGALDLTPAGANFILENLYSERTPRETKRLQRIAEDR